MCLCLFKVLVYGLAVGILLIMVCEKSMCVMGMVKAFVNRYGKNTDSASFCAGGDHFLNLSTTVKQTKSWWTKMVLFMLTTSGFKGSFTK